MVIELKLDSTDIAILRLLQKNARISIEEIGQVVRLSHTPIWRRIDKLEKAGVILGATTKLNRSALALDLTVFTELKLSRHDEKAVLEFERAVHKVPEVLDCHTMTGSWDYMLKIVTRSVESYEAVLKSKVLHLPHVQDVHSRIALREIKQSDGLPI